jgi:chaperonin GroES
MATVTAEAVHPLGADMLNTSGLAPLDLRVLVLPDTAETVTKGGIILPESTAEQKRMAMMFGTLVAIGENAWEEAVARGPHFNRPKPGDRVVFAKYGGIVVTGKDGKDYRLMNDEDVVGREMEA